MSSEGKIKLGLRTEAGRVAVVDLESGREVEGILKAGIVSEVGQPTLAFARWMVAQPEELAEDDDEDERPTPPRGCLS